MDGWLNGWMDGWLYVWMDEWLIGLMYRQTAIDAIYSLLSDKCKIQQQQLQQQQS